MKMRMPKKVYNVKLNKLKTKWNNARNRIILKKLKMLDKVETNTK